MAENPEPAFIAETGQAVFVTETGPEVIPITEAALAAAVTLSEVQPVQTVETAVVSSPESRRGHGQGHGYEKRRHGHHNQYREVSPGAAWAPPWTEHELHALKVYERHLTKSSPTCPKYPRDLESLETNQDVNRKRVEEADKSRFEARRRHKHEQAVMQRAQEIERLSHAECGRYSKQKQEYKSRMKKRELESRPPYRNRAEQEMELGLSLQYRPGSA